ncbi:MAG: HlyD family type I secretion periplasmic adaptor subunit, partial [Beijerinckiaceae bacterium]
LYMLQLFERVMQSRSLPTLLYLSLIALALTVLWTLLEVIRLKLLQRVATDLYARMAPKVFMRLNRRADRLPPLTRQVAFQDMNLLRDFASGGLIVQFLDLLHAPLFILIAFLFHPILGLALLVLSLLIGGLTLLHQRLIRPDTLRGLQAMASASEFGRAVMQAAEPARVMGMLPALTERWRRKQDEALGWQEAGADRAAFVGGALKFLRHAYPLAMLAIGVLLFLEQLVGAGIIFAASLLATRAVGPVDAVASNARGFAAAKAAARRINTLLADPDPERLPLEPPCGALTLARVTAAPPRSENAVLTDVSLTVDAGRVLGVVGASGAGKSSLARVLTGAWRPRRGQVTIGGQDISHFDPDALGRAVGYVPQEVRLLPGTLAENIRRFRDDDEDSTARVMAAVRLAGIEDIVRSAPDGLNTDMGPDGHRLSGGQLQRVALARAVFGDPHLIVLDEPNSNLDAMGETQLGGTISRLRDAGAVVVLITHRLSMLTVCDDVLVMHAGSVQAFGRKEQVLARLPAWRAAPQAQRPPALAAGAGPMPKLTLGRINAVARSKAEAPAPSKDWRRPMRVGYGLIAVGLGGFLLWASLARLDGAALASGVVAVESNRRTLQHLEGGIVREILVRDGDNVQEGQVLIRLDPTRTDAQGELYRSQLLIFMAQEARLAAEREGRDTFDLPPEVAARAGDPAIAPVVRDQQLQFASRRLTMRRNIDVAEAQIAQAQKEIEQNDADLTTSRSMLGNVEKELRPLQDLFRRGLVPLTRVATLEREQLRLRGVISNGDLQREKLKERLGEARLRRQQAIDDPRAEAAGQLLEVRRLINDVRQQIVITSDQQQRSELRAPVAGAVQQMRIVTEGGVVRPGDPILDLVPASDTLVIRAKVSPLDVDRVMPGMIAELRFPSFRYFGAAVVTGALRSVSRDRLLEQDGQTAYFAAEVAVSREALPPELAGKLTAG